MYRHREQTYGCQRGKGEREEQIWARDQQAQTTKYKIDKQQVSTG